MNCQELQEIIHAYFDGELDLVRSLAVERHLQDCALCARAHQARQSLRAAMAGGALYFPLPKGLEERVRSAIGRPKQAETPPPPWWTRWNLSWPGRLIPLATTALLLLIAWPLFTHFSANQGVVDEVLSAHVRSLMSDTAHLTDVASSDQHTVKPWFTGKLSFSPAVVDLGHEGFPLLGGRLDYIENQPVAALVYQRRKHFINLFIWPAGPGGGTRRELEGRQGYNLIRWVEFGMVHWAVSDVSPKDLREFVQLVQSGSAPTR